MNHKIERFIADRNRVLLTGDYQQVRAWMMQSGKPAPHDDRVMEITMHQAITAIPSLPYQYRLASKKWLYERGYHSLDDGDLVMDG